MRFFKEKNDQLVREFLSDYNVAYEDVTVVKLTARISGELEKETISSMLKDSRVAEIIYEIVW